MEYEILFLLKQVQDTHWCGKSYKGAMVGDNFSILKTETGMAMLGLSDRIGTGRKPEMRAKLCFHSRQMMEAGFRTETA